MWGSSDRRPWVKPTCGDAQGSGTRAAQPVPGGHGGAEKSRLSRKGLCMVDDCVTFNLHSIPLRSLYFKYEWQEHTRTLVLFLDDFAHPLKHPTVALQVLEAPAPCGGWAGP